MPVFKLIKRVPLVLAWLQCIPPVSAQLIGTPGANQLNVLFLVEAIAIFFVVVAMFFFWNRLLGIVIGFSLRTFLWKSSRIHVTIESIQISPLAGRVLFKDVRYHSTNMSARILLGHVTWRFWKWKVRKEGSSDRSPSRCLIHLEGLEWFLYNRSPAFDAIVDRMQAANETAADTQAVRETDEGHLKFATESSRIDPDDILEKIRDGDQKQPERLARPLSPPIPNVGILGGRLSNLLSKKHQEPWQWQRDLMPIDIEITTGAVVIGNDATPIVTIAEFKRGTGSLETTESRSPLDIFKSVASFSFTSVKVIVRTNPDYTGALLDHGRRAYEDLIKSKPSILNQLQHTFVRRSAFLSLAKEFQWLSNQFFAKPPTYASAYYGPDKEWKGLVRYRADVDADIGPSDVELEYAKVTTVLEAHKVDLLYYSDVAGTVPASEPEDSSNSSAADSDAYDVGNGGMPPEWGLEFAVEDAHMIYGPWHDRQRDAFTKAFTPAIFYQSTKTDRLKPGDFRMHTEMRVHIQLNGSTTIRVPTREASKDWSWDKLGQAVHTEQRKYGWIDIGVASGSTIHYVMPLAASQAGFDATMEMQFQGFTASSSINYANFMRSQICKMKASMPAPLSWNARRDWTFDIDLIDPQISLLRDHITLMSDLAKDWSSGSTGDFHHFVPCDYQFRVNLVDYSLKLYVNDFNIVDSPNSVEANCFLDIRGAHTHAEVEVPLIRFRPESSTIPFSVQGTNIHLDMSLPIWHSQNAFGTPNTSRFGKVDDLRLRGSYLYYANPSPDHVESLTLFIHLDGVAFRAIGWIIRRLMLIKDNYAGAFLNFQTTHDFLTGFHKTPRQWGDRTGERYRPGKSDIFEVDLEVEITRGRTILPCELYDCQRAIVIPVPRLEIHLRTHEAYMELMVNAQPTSLFYLDESVEYFRTSRASSYTGKRLHIEGVSIRANRLFGRPPKNSTYLCLWEFSIPEVGGHCDLEMIDALQMAIPAFNMSFGDYDNAPLPIYIPPAEVDATFYKVLLPKTEVCFWSGADALNLRLSGLLLDSNDRASRIYSSITMLSIVSIDAALYTELSCHSIPKYFRLAKVSSGLHISYFKSPNGWQEKALSQQMFLRSQDRSTCRVTPMYAPGHEQANILHMGPLFLPQVYRYEERSANGTMSQELDLDVTDKEQLKKLDYAASFLVRENRPSVSNENIQYDSDGIYRQTGESLLRSTLLSKILPVYQRQTQRGETAFTLKQQPPAGLQVDHVSGALHDLVSKPYSESGPTPDPYPLQGSPNNRLSTVTTIRLTEKLDIFLAPEALLSYGRTTRMMTEKQHSEVGRRLEYWLDDALVASWRKFSDRHLPKTSSSEVYNLIGPSIQLRTIAVRDHVSPLLGFTKGEGADFDIVVLGVQAFQPSFRFVRRRILSIDGSYQETVTSTMRAHQGHCCIRVKDSSKPNPTINIAIEEKAIAELAWRGLSISSSQHTSYTNLIGRFDSLIADVATNSTPSLLLIAETWLRVVAQYRNLTNNVPNYQLQAEDLAKLIVYAEDKGLAGLPAFMYHTGSLLRPPDTWISAQNATSFRQDVRWKILSQLRFYLQEAEQLDTYAFERSSPTDSAGLYHKICRHFAQEHDWIIAPTDLASLLDNRVPGHPAHSAGQSEESGRTTLSFACRHLSISLYELQALEGHRLAILKVEDMLLLSKEIANGLGDKPIVTYAILSSSLYAAAHVDAVSVFESNAVCVEEFLVSRRPTSGNTTSGGGQKSPVKRIDRVVMGVSKIEVHFDAEPIQIVFEIKQMHALLKRNITEQDGSQITIGVSAPADATFEVKKVSITIWALASSRSNLRIQVPRSVRLTSLSLGGVKASLHDLDLTTEDSNGTGTILVSYVCLLTCQEPQYLHGIVLDWKAKRFSSLQQIIQRIHRRYTTNGSNRQESLDGPVLTLPFHRITLSIRKTSIQMQASENVMAFWYCEPSHVHILNGPHNTLYVNGRLMIGAQSSGFARVRPLEPGSVQPENPDVMLQIPSIAIKATISLVEELVTVKGDLVVESFSGCIQPLVLERILHVWTAVKQDVHIVLDAVRSVQELQSSRSSTMHRRHLARQFRYTLNLRSHGVEVALRSAQTLSTLTAKTGTILGQLSSNGGLSGLQWDANISSLEVTLGHLSSERPADLKQTRRSAHIRFRLQIAQMPEVYDAMKQHPIHPATIDIFLFNAHAALQIPALGELHDLVNSWSSDVQALRARQEAEWTQVITKTEKFVQAETSARQTEANWFQTSRFIRMRLTSLAIAIPLHLNTSTLLSTVGPTVLFTVAKVIVINQKGESGKIEVMDVTFQVANSFDLNDRFHYDSVFHRAQNQMVLPHTLLQVKVISSVQKRDVRIKGIIKGFELRMDPEIVTFALMLEAVCEAGKSRITELAKQYRSDHLGGTSEPQLRDPSENASRTSLGDVSVAFDFISGTVMLHRSAASTTYSAAGQRTTLALGDITDNFKLPGISLWIQVGREARQLTLEPVQTVQILVVVHKSENLIRPSILQFIKDINKKASLGLDSRRRHVSRNSDQQGDFLPSEYIRPDTSNLVRSNRLSTTRWSVALRIDHSRIRLTCMPDSPVHAGLAWHSGGFTAQYDPLKKIVVASIAVTGVAFDVRHEWLKDQECVVGRITNLTGTLAYNELHLDVPASLSLAIDTEVSLELKMSRAQDLLCFKAVWIDGLDLPTRAVDTDKNESPTSTPTIEMCTSVADESTKRGKVVMYIQIRRLDLSADLVVSRIHLQLDCGALRVKRTSLGESIAIRLDQLRVDGSGIVSGSVSNEQLRLKARRYPRDMVAQNATMLHMQINTSQIGIQIAHESQPIAVLTMLPSTISIHDDWSDNDLRGITADTSLSISLTFELSLGRVDGFVAILALPALLESFERLENNWDHQVENAKAESESYRRYFDGKPDNAFAAVSMAMQRSAQRKRTDSCPVNLRVIRVMGLSMARTRLGVYMSSLTDAELYRLSFDNLVVRFKRETGLDNNPMRHFTATIRLLQLYRYTTKPPLYREGEALLPLEDWHDKVSSTTRSMRVIAMPTTTANMDSIEYLDNHLLAHDFALDYGNGRLEVDFQVGVFKEMRDTLEIFRRLWARRRATHVTVGEAPTRSTSCDLTLSKSGEVNVQAPQMNILGDTAQDLIGRYGQTWLESSPHHTHHFLIYVLEPGMNVLLKLYDQLLD